MSRSSEEFVELLSVNAGLAIEEASYGPLARSLADYLDAIRAIPLKEMLEVDPGLAFDPHWKEPDH